MYNATKTHNLYRKGYLFVLKAQTKLFRIEFVFASPTF